MALTQKLDKSNRSLILRYQKRREEKRRGKGEKKRKRKRRKIEEKRSSRKRKKVRNYEFLHEFPCNCMDNSLPQT